MQATNVQTTQLAALLSGGAAPGGEDGSGDSFLETLRGQLQGLLEGLDLEEDWDSLESPGELQALMAQLVPVLQEAWVQTLDAGGEAAAEMATDVSASGTAMLAQLRALLQGLSTSAQSLTAMAGDAAGTDSLATLESLDGEEWMERLATILQSANREGGVRLQPDTGEEDPEAFLARLQQASASWGAQQSQAMAAAGALPAATGASAPDSSPGMSQLLSRIEAGSLENPVMTPPAAMTGTGAVSSAASPVAPSAALDFSSLTESQGIDQLGEKIRWLSRAGEDSAEVKLHPPHLGSLEVRISLNEGKTHVQFFAANASVRETLETALPRLRESLGQEGLTLGDVSVSDHSWSGGGEQSAHSNGSHESGFSDPFASEEEDAAIAANSGDRVRESILNERLRRLDVFG